MVTPIDPVLKEIWSKEAKAAYQETENRLLNPNTVDLRKGTGSVYKFTKRNRHEEDLSTPRNRFDALTPKGGVYQSVNCVPEELISYLYIDYTDINKTDEDLRAGYTFDIMADLNRKVNKAILDVATAGATAITLPTANTMNAAGGAAIRKKFAAAKVPQTGRVLVLSNGAVEDLQNDEKFINRDYFASEIVKNGLAPNAVYGMSAIEMMEGLSAGAVGTTNVAWHNKALGVFQNREFEFDVQWSVERQSWVVIGKVSLGAVIVEPTAVFKFDITD